MYLLGYDIGSSSIKASLINAESGVCIASAFSPEQEMQIISMKPGWAEQHPETWWENLIKATRSMLAKSRVNPIDIKAIGISYQMHGLVCVNKDYQVIRPSIIWCDSRAVEIGNKAFAEIGEKTCQEHLLNSPGNFTASKLRWMRENEPELYDKIYKFMLPGDYIALRMTGECCTTVSGLSEGILWDFKNQQIAQFLLDYYEIDNKLIPQIIETFSEQGKLTPGAAKELGLNPGTPVTYRSGDQPNNALSLHVNNPGDIAATAGTSGVVYGISDVVRYDPLSRVNTFIHLNHKPVQPGLGVLLCINGTGILNSWMKNNIAVPGLSYDEINQLASEIQPGCKGLMILPFGNGAERMLENKETNANFYNLNFNIHSSKHLLRAAQEGIAFAFHYGMQIMKETGINIHVIRAGHQNMFLSKVFRQTLADISHVCVELYDTDGAQGAAKGAGIGAKIYATFEEAFQSLTKQLLIEPDEKNRKIYLEVYDQWKNVLDRL